MISICHHKIPQQNQKRLNHKGSECANKSRPAFQSVDHSSGSSQNHWKPRNPERRESRGGRVRGTYKAYFINTSQGYQLGSMESATVPHFLFPKSSPTTVRAAQNGQLSISMDSPLAPSYGRTLRQVRWNRQ